MFLGLCNSPSTFQTIMNKIFANMKDVVVIYIDDIMIFTKINALKKHNEIMVEVLYCLKENDLYVKSEKYTFCTTEVDFPGIIVGKDGIKMNQDKFKAILDWPALTSIKGGRSFLGLANFIKDLFRTIYKLQDL